MEGDYIGPNAVSLSGHVLVVAAVVPLADADQPALPDKTSDQAKTTGFSRGRSGYRFDIS